jgi:hypothetical protein
VARVVGTGIANAGVAAMEGGENSDIVEAGAKGAAFGAGGELVGRVISALGPAAHRVLSRFTGKEQANIVNDAKVLSEARATLAEAEPKLATGGENPAYVKADEAAKAAEKRIKDLGQNPDDMVYAYEQVKAGASKGETMTQRSAAELKDIGRGYDELRTQAKAQGEAYGVTNVKGNQPLTEGPMSRVRSEVNPTGRVEATYAKDAESAEMLMRAPAKDMGERWANLQKAGSELLTKERDALFAGDQTKANAMRELFGGVRAEQAKAAEALYGKEAGAAVIKRLEGLDKRYATIMNATGGMNYEKMRQVLAQGNSVAARKLEAEFKAFAKGDPDMLRVFNALKADARGELATASKLMKPLAVLHKAGQYLPLGGDKLAKALQDFVRWRTLGRDVKMKDLVRNEHDAILARASNVVAGSLANQ